MNNDLNNFKGYQYTEVESRIEDEVNAVLAGYDIDVDEDFDDLSLSESELDSVYNKIMEKVRERQQKC